MTEARTTMGRGRGRGRIVAVALALVVLLAACDWPMFGYGASHTRYNPTEKAIGVGNVASLKTAWTGVINPGGPTGNLFLSRHRRCANGLLMSAPLITSSTRSMRRARPAVPVPRRPCDVPLWMATTGGIVNRRRRSRTGVV